MTQWSDYLPFLIPLGVAQFALAIFSVFQFIGPAVYFLFGRGDEE